MVAKKIEISGHTRLYAVIGDPIRHSLSPRIMNSAFAANCLDAVYVALPVQEQDAALAMDMVRRCGLAGVNVTMPLKQAIVPFLDQLSPTAQQVGAANCVINDQGVLTGHNTDCTGFRLSLSKHFPAAPNSAFLLGAGGAARAIAAELVRWGCRELMICNRSQARAEELAGLFQEQAACRVEVVPWVPGEWPQLLNRTDLFINATSLGMGDNGSVAELIDWRAIERRPLIYETVYNPLETDLLTRARKHRCPVVVGTELLLWQAAAGFEIWTGQVAPVAVMRESLLRGLR